MSMEIDAGTLSALATDIWTSMLGIELQPGSGTVGELSGARTLTGCVQITGGWAGAVTIRCATAAAARFAAVMFGCDADSLSDEEVRDALGELTNMLAGSVKGMVPDECQLGIPAVADGLDYMLFVPKGKVLTKSELAHENDVVEVLVYELA
jgi:chemotaxis protein CheX